MRDYISALEATLALMQGDLQQKAEEYSRFIAQGPGPIYEFHEHRPAQNLREFDRDELRLTNIKSKEFNQREQEKTTRSIASPTPTRSQLDTLYESDQDEEEDKTLADIDLSAIFNEVKLLQTAETDKLWQNQTFIDNRTSMAKSDNLSCT